MVVVVVVELVVEEVLEEVLEEVPELAEACPEPPVRVVADEAGLDRCLERAASERAGAQDAASNMTARSAGTATISLP